MDAVGPDKSIRWADAELGRDLLRAKPPNPVATVNALLRNRPASSSGGSTQPLDLDSNGWPHRLQSVDLSQIRPAGFSP